MLLPESFVHADVTILSANTTDFKVCGNPNLLERLDLQSTDNPSAQFINQVRTFTYSYVDPTTNTYIHSHGMEIKKGNFL